MKKLFFLLGLTAPILFAQGDSTIFQQVLIGSTNVAPSGLIRNIGQSTHLVTWSIGNAAPNVCAAPGWSGRAQLEGSFDNTNFVRIGQPISNLQLTFPAVTWAWGAYPYLRINYLVNSTPFCTLSANYSGTLNGAKISPLFDSTVKNGLATSDFVTVGAGAVSVGLCTSTAARLSLYSFYLNNTTAGTLTGVKFTLEDATPSVLETITIGSMATLSSVHMDHEVIPILGSNQYALNTAVYPLHINITSSAAGLQGWIQQRCE